MRSDLDTFLTFAPILIAAGFLAHLMYSHYVYDKRMEAARREHLKCMQEMLNKIMERNNQKK